MKRLGLGIAIGFLGLVLPAAGQAQSVIVREGAGDVFIDHRIDRMLRRGGYVLYRAPSTTIAAGETIQGDALVLGGDFYLDGTIVGDLLAIDADVFLRPGSRVTGDVVNAGGGLYRSEQSAVGRSRSLPNHPYSVREERGRIVIVSADRYDPLELDGFFGFRVPEYNRVDGFAPEFGFTYRARPFLAGFAPGVRGLVGYRTEPGEVTGGGSVFLERGGFGIEGGWRRATRSNDRWIRGDIRNSADFLLDGDDMRNYYDADVAWGEARYRFGSEALERYVTVGLRYEQEDAGSMRAHNPWTIRGDEPLRPNPRIDDGTISSFIPFARAEWLTPRTYTEALVEVEAGSADLDPFDDIADCAPAGCPETDGSFTRLRIDTEFAMQALLDHTLEIEIQFMMPLGGDEPLPRQRWGMLGGSGTIRTVADGAFYGDHLAYSETEYVIPLRFARVRRVTPTFELLHMAGRAWTGERGDDEGFVQNVGARVNVWAFYARYLVDPDSGADELTVGVSWPFDQGYPWQE